MVKKLLYTLIFCFIAATSISQNCLCISGTKDKKNGIETVGGITGSRDFYSLNIQKKTHYEDLSLEPEYYLFLHAASTFMFSDNMLNTKGKIELLLKDNSKLILENVRCLNDPLHIGVCIAFDVAVTKEQMETIAKNPIVVFSAFDILTTSFSERKQKRQQKIVNCLLNMD